MVIYERALFEWHITEDYYHKATGKKSEKLRMIKFIFETLTKKKRIKKITKFRASRSLLSGDKPSRFEQNYEHVG